MADHPSFFNQYGDSSDVLSSTLLDILKRGAPGGRARLLREFGEKVDSERERIRTRDPFLREYPGVDPGAQQHVFHYAVKQLHVSEMGHWPAASKLPDPEPDPAAELARVEALNREPLPSLLEYVLHRHGPPVRA